MANEDYQRYEQVDFVLRNTAGVAGEKVYTLRELDPMYGERVSAIDADKGLINELNFPPRGECQI